MTILIKANCMLCGLWRDCRNVSDIGWICEACYSPLHHGCISNTKGKP